MKYYKNNITGTVSYSMPIDFNVKGLWSTYDDGSSSSSGSKTTTSTAGNSKSSFGDTFGAVVSSLTASLPAVLGAFGIGGKTPTSQPQVATASGSAPLGGSPSGSTPASQKNGSSFNWTMLLLPVIGIVVIVLLITKK